MKLDPKLVRRVIIALGALTAIAGAATQYVQTHEAFDWKAFAFAVGSAVATYAMKYKGDFAPDEVPATYPVAKPDNDA